MVRVRRSRPDLIRTDARRWNAKGRARAGVGDRFRFPAGLVKQTLACFLVIVASVSVTFAAPAQDAATARTAFEVGGIARSSLVPAEPSSRRKFWTRTASA